MQRKPNPLADFSTDQLLEELVRRRNVREQRRPVDSWCDDCAHFVVKADAGDGYNPCVRGHRMSFWHLDDGNPHGEFGFYRRICADRTTG